MCPRCDRCKGYSLYALTYTVPGLHSITRTSGADALVTAALAIP